jgi:hypothetical protein
MAYIVAVTKKPPSWTNQPLTGPYVFKNVAFATIFLVVGLGLIWFGATSLSQFFHDSSGRAPLVILSPKNSLTLPLGIGFLGLGIGIYAGLLVARHVQQTSQSGYSHRGNKRQNSFLESNLPALTLGILFLSIIATVFAPLITEVSQRMTLAKRAVF